MKAILCTRFGGPDDLEFADLPDPRPGAGEVVVAVKSAALNFFDTLIIAGKYQLKLVNEEKSISTVIEVEIRAGQTTAKKLRL